MSTNKVEYSAIQRIISESASETKPEHQVYGSSQTDRSLRKTIVEVPKTPERPKAIPNCPDAPLREGHKGFLPEPNDGSF